MAYVVQTMELWF